MMVACCLGQEKEEPELDDDQLLEQAITQNRLAAAAKPAPSALQPLPQAKRKQKIVDKQREKQQQQQAQQAKEINDKMAQQREAALWLSKIQRPLPSAALEANKLAGKASLQDHFSQKRQLGLAGLGPMGVPSPSRDQATSSGVSTGQGPLGRGVPRAGAMTVLQQKRKILAVYEAMMSRGGDPSKVERELQLANDMGIRLHTGYTMIEHCQRMREEASRKQTINAAQRMGHLERNPLIPDLPGARTPYHPPWVNSRLAPLTAKMGDTDSSPTSSHQHNSSALGGLSGGFPPGFSDGLFMGLRQHQMGHERMRIEHEAQEICRELSKTGDLDDSRDLRWLEDPHQKQVDATPRACLDARAGPPSEGRNTLYERMLGNANRRGPKRDSTDTSAAAPPSALPSAQSLEGLLPSSRSKAAMTEMWTDEVARHADGLDCSSSDDEGPEERPPQSSAAHRLYRSLMNGQSNGSLGATSAEQQLPGKLHAGRKNAAAATSRPEPHRGTLFAPTKLRQLPKKQPNPRKLPAGQFPGLPRPHCISSGSSSDDDRLDGEVLPVLQRIQRDLAADAAGSGGGGVHPADPLPTERPHGGWGSWLPAKHTDSRPRKGRPASFGSRPSTEEALLETISKSRMGMPGQLQSKGDTAAQTAMKMASFLSELDPATHAAPKDQHESPSDRTAWEDSQLDQLSRLIPQPSGKDVLAIDDVPKEHGKGLAQFKQLQQHSEALEASRSLICPRQPHSGRAHGSEATAGCASRLNSAKQQTLGEQDHAGIEGMLHSAGTRSLSQIMEDTAVGLQKKIELLSEGTQTGEDGDRELLRVKAALLALDQCRKGWQLGEGSSDSDDLPHGLQAPCPAAPHASPKESADSFMSGADLRGPGKQAGVAHLPASPPAPGPRSGSSGNLRGPSQSVLQADAQAGVAPGVLSMWGLGPGDAENKRQDQPQEVAELKHGAPPGPSARLCGAVQGFGADLTSRPSRKNRRFALDSDSLEEEPSDDTQSPVLADGSYKAPASGSQQDGLPGSASQFAQGPSSDPAASQDPDANALSAGSHPCTVPIAKLRDLCAAAAMGRNAEAKQRGSIAPSPDMARLPLGDMPDGSRSNGLDRFAPGGPPAAGSSSRAAPGVLSQSQREQMSWLDDGHQERLKRLGLADENFVQ